MKRSLQPVRTLGSNPTDDREVDVLESDGDNPTLQELEGALATLNIDEQLDLLALTWLGRGDFPSFERARQQAEDVRTSTLMCLSRTSSACWRARSKEGKSPQPSRAERKQIELLVILRGSERALKLLQSRVVSVTLQDIDLAVIRRVRASVWIGGSDLFIELPRLDDNVECLLCRDCPRPRLRSLPFQR